MGTRLIAYETVTRPSELVRAVSWLQLGRSWKSLDFIVLNLFLVNTTTQVKLLLNLNRV